MYVRSKGMGCLEPVEAAQNIDVEYDLRFEKSGSETTLVQSVLEGKVSCRKPTDQIPPGLYRLHMEDETTVLVRAMEEGKIIGVSGL